MIQNSTPTSSVFTPPQLERFVPKVLFLCHSATLTGAPLVLYHLVSWLKQERFCSFEVLIRDDGPMVQKFAELGLTRTLPSDADAKISLPKSWLRRIWARPEMPEKDARDKLLKELKAQEFDLIYANTITVGNLLEWLAPLNCPVVTHVHELEHWIKASGEVNFEHIKHHTDFYIAAAHAVKNNLIDQHGIDPASIEVVHEFIAVGAVADVEHQRGTLRRRLNLPDGVTVVVGSGHESWRKGKDLFVELCHEVNRRVTDSTVYFLWVGGWESSHHRTKIEQMVSTLGLEDKILFTGQVDNPFDYFAASDIFALVSREDPYPLVCLEAAAVGKPILCFAGCGGMPEFVEWDAGIIVPHLDIEAMTSAVVGLIENPDQCRRLGMAAKTKVATQHDVTVSAPKLLKIVNHVKNTKRQTLRNKDSLPAADTKLLKL